MAGQFRTGSGSPQPGSALRRVPPAVRRAIPAELEAAALLLARQVKLEYSTPGRGRIRQHTVTRKGAGSFARTTLQAERITRRRVRHKDGTVEIVLDIRSAGDRVLKRRHRGAARIDLAKATRASAPGDPPAPDRGALRNSVQVSHLPNVARPTVRVATNAEQADALEFGTKTAGRSHKVVILPRPAWRPALAKVRAAMSARVAGGGLRTRVAASLRSSDAGGA